MFAKARNLICTIFAPPAYKRPPIFNPRLSIVMEGKRLACNVPDAKVLHDPVGQEFHIEFENNCRAFLQYKMEGDIIKIMHTEVPKEVGGKGYGKVLAQAALKHIEKNKYKAEAYCDYFFHYVETYEPEYLKYFEKQN